VRIDPEFRALIAPLALEELAQLEANLEAHGCRDPLVVWRGYLIDGHNRYEICSRLKLEYRTVEIVLPSRAHVLLWIEENQLGRRNLTDDQRAHIGESVLERRAALARSERAKKGGRGKKKNPEAAVASKFRERAAVSKTARVSERKLRAIREIKKAAPELAAEIRAGTLTILKARAEIKRRKKQAVTQQIEAEAPQFPQGPFRVIVIDPPWQYDKRAEDPTHRARTPYPTMTLAELVEKVPVENLAHADSVLWLWTTNAFLREAFELLEAWKFTYRTLLTWGKDRMGVGDWLRGQTEHCLMATRGQAVINLTNQTTLLLAPMREHSRKPDEFFALVDRLCPGNRLELFARQERPGWSTWGAEKDKFQRAL
jgi:N6-adenosine-specific RNA methylase IME4